MFPFQGKRAASAAAILAVSAALGLTALTDTAQAAQVDYFLKLSGVEGESTDATTTQGSRLARPEGRVCCSVGRKAPPVLLKLAQCRKQKGVVLPQMKCAQAAKPSDAYFVKVDRETTTQSSSATSGPASVRPN